MRRTPHNLKAWLMAGVFVLPAGLAHAQAQTDAPAALEEVIVTAQRQEETAQRAAIPLSVISPRDMVNMGVTQAGQLTRLTPALQGQDAGSASLFYIRGVGTFSANSYTDPAVAFSYDGVYIARPAGTNGYFYDLDRIEVLKGPQGTLYGRNATGGAINVIPKAPSFDSTSGYVSGELGNYEAYRLEGAVNAAMSDKVAARIAGFYLKHDGYNSDGSDGDRTYGGRMQLRFEPSDTLSVRVSADYAHFGGTGGGSQIRSYVNNADYAAYAAAASAPVYGSTGIPRTTAAPYPAGVGVTDARTTALFQTIFSPGLGGRNLDGVPVTPFRDNENWGFSTQIDWKIGPGTLTIIPAYRQSDLDVMDVSASFYFPQTDKDHQKSVELRYASPNEGMFRYILGVYWFKERALSNAAYNNEVILPIQHIDTSTESVAEFARVTFAPRDNLRFVAAVRNTRDHKTFDGASDVVSNICLAAACPTAPLFGANFTAADVIRSLGLVQVAPGTYISPASPASLYLVSNVSESFKRTDKKVTWRAAVEYDATPSSLIYASVETGFHGGGFSLLQNDPRDKYEPETITAYTLGSKNRFLDNRLQINAELFYWKYKDQQLSHAIIDRGGSPNFATENIGRSTNKGFEVDVKYLVTPDTLLGADLQYLDAKYDEFKYDVSTPTATGCKYTAPKDTTTPGLIGIDCSGKQAIRSPKWTFNFSAQQTVHISDKMQAVLGANTRYQSSSMSYLDYLPEERLSSYWLSNAYVTLQWGDERKYELTAFVNNIENDRQLITNWASVLHVFSSTATSPRTYGVRVRAEF